MRKQLLKLQAAVLLIACVLLGTGQTPVSASGFQTEVRDSVAVVALYMEDQQGNGDVYGWGSGFFVGKKGENPEYLITNHHVVREYLEYGGGEFVEVMFADGSTAILRIMVRVYFDSSTYQEAYVVDYNEKKDVALLRLLAPTDERKPIGLSSPTEDMIGSTVYCVGYPGLSENQIISATSKWGKTDASVTAGTVSRFVTSSGTGVKRIQTDAVIQQGNSGGPLVNEKGYVIGVNSLYIMNETETNYYAVSADEVIPMLKNNNVPFYEEGGFVISTPMLIGIVALVLVLALVIILVVVLSGKNKKTAPQPNMNPMMNPQGMQQPVGMGQPQMAGMGQPQMVSPPTRNGMIRSLSVQHNGMSYPVGTNPILIGRDSSNCAIVYREGTPGVSGRHCTVCYQPERNEFLITDLRSTYGTYLMNGQKLEPNVPYHLGAGESFYVGDKANVLRVEVG